MEPGGRSLSSSLLSASLILAEEFLDARGDDPRKKYVALGRRGQVSHLGRRITRVLHSDDELLRSPARLACSAAKLYDYLTLFRGDGRS